MPEQPTGGQNPPPAPGSLRQLVQKINPVLKKTLGQIQSLPVFTQPQATPPPSGEPVPPPAPTSTPSKSASLNRTVVDMEACMMVISRAVSGQEAKAKEQSIARAAQPLKSVEDYRQALPCNSQWEAMTGTNRFRLCQQCKLNVYDFRNMDQAEAEELVFQREGQPPKSLFQRKDGRFLIKDCPVAQSRARAIIAAGVCAVLALIALGAAYMMMPHSAPPAETATSPPPATAPSAEHSTAKSNPTIAPVSPVSAGGTSSVGTFDPSTGTMVMPISDRKGPADFVPERINNPVVNAEVERYLQNKDNSKDSAPLNPVPTQQSATEAEAPPTTNNDSTAAFPAVPAEPAGNPYVKNY